MPNARPLASRIGNEPRQLSIETWCSMPPAMTSSTGWATQGRVRAQQLLTGVGEAERTPALERFQILRPYLEKACRWGSSWPC